MGLCAGGKLRNFGAQGFDGTVGYSFFCPGCEENHGIWVAQPPGRKGPVWGFNGDTARPTFSPSLLVRSGHYGDDNDRPKNGACWCTWNRDNPGDPAPFKCFVCHSFIVDGRIQFLGDCTHKLAGQTVEIPIQTEE